MTDVFSPNGGVFLRKLAAWMATEGHDLDAAVAARLPHVTTLSAELHNLPAHEHAIVWEVAETLSGDPSIGLRFALASTLRDAGLLGYAFGASSTLSEAVQVLVRLSEQFRLVSPATRTSEDHGLMGTEQSVDVQWDYGSSAKLDLRHWSEFTACLLIRAIGDLTGGRVTPKSVSFTHRARVDADTLEAAFGLVPTYQAGANRLAFAASEATFPFLKADAGLLNLLLEHADLIDRVADLEQNSLAITVERLIMDGMAQGDASLAKVAEQLGISQRTLSRKLATEDTSFFAILEGVRKSLALRYLRQNEKSLSEISFLLGYSSLSSFNDAFRRWTGHSPGNYRNRTARSA